MTGAAVSIRSAAIGDLDRLAAVHEAAARAGYRHIFPADAPFPRDEARGDLRQFLESESVRVFIAEDRNITVGLVVAGPAPENGESPVVSGRVAQIHLLHVLPLRWNGGIGTALHHCAMTALVADGFATAILWVLERNERARRFYEQQGWQTDGGRRRERYAIEIDVIRYRRALP
ncbi:MAG: GNAT family N-acetyltransferase [Dongiaceae bacterium]